VAGLVVGVLAPGTQAAAEELGGNALRQMRAIYADKARWTPAERKLATSLLHAHRESLGQPMVQGLPPLRRVASRAGVDGEGMVVVDIRAEVTDELLQAIAALGGRVASAFPALRAVRARVPIRQVAALSALPEVRYVGPKKGFVVHAGSKTSEGDVAHAAASARTTYGIDGTGVKVGVLSSGVDSLAARQASGDLPATCTATPGPGACITVVPGQAGEGDEGTAMLEIVHDLAPGAKLYFATATDPTAGDAGFAANIRALRNTYGCDVLVDDVTYFDEGAFQDGVIAQAVNAVTGAGALFFSSAGNLGRKDASTSGTWEGDFVDSGTTLEFFTGQAWEGLPIHSFNGLTGASALVSNEATVDAPDVTLKWSDPLGGATNDYDLFVMDSTLTEVYDYSIEDQGTTGQPFEWAWVYGGAYAGDRIVIVLYGHVEVPGEPAVAGGGVVRALRLDTVGGRLSASTARAIVGHNGGESTISVAATSVSSAAGGAFTGGAVNPVEVYSSDGPRRMFYSANGSAITPGAVTFGSGGGRELKKPDITAADCVTTTTPGFTSFCGTSAAAPHAAAIAALLKSVSNHPGGGQVSTAMFTTALDVTPGTGWDRNSGVGIVMANLAAAALTSNPAVDLYTLSPCRVFDTREAGGPTSGAPLTCGADYSFTMVGGACGVPSGAKAVSLNVTVTASTAQGNVRVFASGAPAPLVSTQNYVAGQTRANNAVAPLSTDGKMGVKCSPSGTAHVIVDVNGYFR
jgi:hypothetical protein